MTSVFLFENYRDFITARFKEMPKGGYGQALKLSSHLNVHTTLVSQVLKGKKSFTPEQGVRVCEFLGLSEMETDYFLLLVQMDRCGSATLKKSLSRQMSELKKRARELVNRISSSDKLTEVQGAVFYSDW